LAVTGRPGPRSLLIIITFFHADIARRPTLPQITDCQKPVNGHFESRGLNPQEPNIVSSLRGTLREILLPATLGVFIGRKECLDTQFLQRDVVRRA